MDASIVMPTFNKRPYLEKTLQSLIGQKDAPRFEVVLVDDGSTDDTQEWVETLQTDYPLRYLRTPINYGPAKARNLGLAEAKGPIVIFLDDDRLVTETFVYQHLQSSGPGKITLGQRWQFIEGNSTDPSNELSGERLHYREEEFMRLTIVFQWPLKGSTPLAWLLFATGNLSVWREDILKVGGFDENFPGKRWRCEDTELGYRLSDAGKTYVYQPLAENFHLIHPKSSSYFTDKYDTARYFYHKHRTHEVELFLPFVAGRISFLLYVSEANKCIGKEAPEWTFGDDYSRALTGNNHRGYEVALAYLSSVSQSIKEKIPNLVFSDEYFGALCADCALADDICKGYEAVLALSPGVSLQTKRDVIFLSQSGLFHHKYLFQEFHGLEKKVLSRIDGKTPLSDIILMVSKNTEPSSVEISRNKEFVASLVFKGILRDICRPNERKLVTALEKGMEWTPAL